MILGALAAPARAATVTSTITLPFSGSFFDSVTGEVVNISGYVNVTAHTTLGTTVWMTDLYTALPANVSGTGQTTGARYIANGAVFQTFEYPLGPVKPVFALVVFKIWPPGPIFPPAP